MPDRFPWALEESQNVPMCVYEQFLSISGHHGLSRMQTSIVENLNIWVGKGYDDETSPQAIRIIDKRRF
jgi:hypothetical protein